MFVSSFHNGSAVALSLFISSMLGRICQFYFDVLRWNGFMVRENYISSLGTCKQLALLGL